MQRTNETMGCPSPADVSTMQSPPIRYTIEEEEEILCKSEDQGSLLSDHVFSYITGKVHPWNFNHMLALRRPK